MTETVRTLAVVPTYDEADNIEEFLRRFRAANPDIDVLVVDDSSPDGTGAIVERIAEELGHIELTVQAIKGGLGTAYRHGIGIGLERGYDAVLQIDADMSHDPAVVPALQAALVDGIGMVIGSRYVPGGSIPHWPFHRRALSKWGNRYTRFALGMKVSDTTSGLRLWRADTVRRTKMLATHSRGYLFQIEMAYRVVRTGEHLAEVPIAFTDRVRGTSKMSGAVIWEELTRVTWWGIRDRILRRPVRY